MSTEHSLRETLKILIGSPLLQGGDVEAVLDTLRSAEKVVEEEAPALRCVRNKSHTSSGLRLAMERTLELISSRRAECTSRIAGPSRVVDDTDNRNRATAKMSCESTLKAPSRLESDVLLPESSMHHRHYCRRHRHHGSGTLGTRGGLRLPSPSEHRGSRLRSDSNDRLRDRMYQALLLSHRPSVLAMEPRVHGVQEGLQEGRLAAGSNQELLPLLLCNAAAMSIASGVDDVSVHLRRARRLCTTTATAGMQATSLLLPPSQQLQRRPKATVATLPTARLGSEVLQLHSRTAAPSTTASLVDLFLQGDGW